MIEGKAIAKFGTGDILMTALCEENGKDCCVVLQNKGTGTIGEKISTDEFEMSENDTILSFTDTRSIDVLVSKLFEAKLMMDGVFRPKRTIECKY